MYQKSSPKGARFTFRSFSRKGYSLFAALGCEVKIGVLAVATLGTAAPSLAAANPTQRVAQVRDKEQVATLDDDQRLGEVVTTASRTPLAADQAARKVMTLSRAELAAAGVTSINDALKLCAGVDVRQRGAFGVQTDISINGGTFDQITILVNGIAINNPQTGHNAADFPLNLADIERIEVLEGAASRVLGTQAFSGAINIVTRQAGPTLYARAAGGSYGTAQAELRGLLRQQYANGNNLSSSLSASYQRSDGAVRNGDFKGGKAFWQGRLDAPHYRIDAQAGFTQTDFGANTFYSTKSTDQWESTKRVFASLKGETKTLLHVAPQISWLRNYDHFQFFRNTPIYENFNRGDVLTAGLNAWLPWSLGRTAFGAEVRHEQLYSGNLGFDLKPEQRFLIAGQSADKKDDKGIWKTAKGSLAEYTKAVDRTNVSFFAEHDILLQNWSVSLGFLAQRNSAFGQKFRFYPGVDVAYRPSANWKLYASWNKSLRLPTFTDFFYKSPSQEGNTNLRPEENSAFRLGTTFTPAEGVTMNVFALYNHGLNVMDWVMYNAQDKFHATNFQLDTYGVSASMMVDGAQVLGENQPIRRLRLDYAYLTQQRKDAVVYFKSNYALEYLRHKFVATLDHRVYSRLNASWVFRLQERNGNYVVVDRTNPAKLKETGQLQPYGLHGRLDLKLHWDAKNYSFFCDLQNLTNHRFFDLANVEQPGIVLMAGASYQF